MGFGSFGGGGGRILYETVEEDLSAWGRELFGDPTRYITFAAHMNPVCANDADAQVLYFPKSLHIPAGVTLTPSNRCKGLIVYVNGHLKIDGTISMTDRGPSAAGVDTPLTAVVRKTRRVTRTIGRTTTVLEDVYDQVFGTIGVIPAVGGAGGPANTGGTAGTARKCGGGGGGFQYSGTAGAGGAATSYAGGAGGGGSAGSSSVGTAGSSTGGAGGTGLEDGLASSGAGNPGGGGAYPGATGIGGVILLIARGNIYIEATGVISANGAAGGGNGSAYGGTGGGSGAGSINIGHGGTYTNLGTVRANGGAGGSNSHGYVGGAGGAGCITVEQVAL